MNFIKINYFFVRYNQGANLNGFTYHPSKNKAKRKIFIIVRCMNGKGYVNKMNKNSIKIK